MSAVLLLPALVDCSRWLLPALVDCSRCWLFLAVLMSPSGVDYSSPCWYCPCWYCPCWYCPCAVHVRCVRAVLNGRCWTGGVERAESPTESFHILYLILWDIKDFLRATVGPPGLRRAKGHGQEHRAEGTEILTRVLRGSPRLWGDQTSRTGPGLDRG